MAKRSDHTMLSTWPAPSRGRAKFNETVRTKCKTKYFNFSSWWLKWVTLTCNIFWTWRITEIEGIKWGSCIVIKFTSPQGTSCQDGKRNICGIVPTEIMTLNQCNNENETTVFHFWSFIKWDSSIHFHYKKRILQKMISLPQRVLKSWARNRVIAKCLDVYSDKVNCGFAFVFCT